MQVDKLATISNEGAEYVAVNNGTVVVESSDPELRERSILRLTEDCLLIERSLVPTPLPLRAVRPFIYPRLPGTTLYLHPRKVIVRDSPSSYYRTMRLDDDEELSDKLRSPSFEEVIPLQLYEVGATNDPINKTV
jgi:hypothetical protein